MVQIGPVSCQDPQCILMDAAYYMKPAARQIDTQHQTGRTTIIIRAVFDDLTALDGLSDISQQDSTLIKPSL